jgi:hypothetical protein
MPRNPRANSWQGEFPCKTCSTTATRALPRSGPSLRTGTVCMTWRVTYGNGLAIGLSRTMLTKWPSPAAAHQSIRALSRQPRASILRRRSFGFHGRLSNGLAPRTIIITRGNFFPSSPPRAANSHPASVGSCFPAQYVVHAGVDHLRLRRWAIAQAVVGRAQVRGAFCVSFGVFMGNVNHGVFVRGHRVKDAGPSVQDNIRSHWYTNSASESGQ